MSRTLAAGVTRWPIAGRFEISRGAKTEAEVVVVTLRDGRAQGRGECVPYGRYGETPQGVLRALEDAAPAFARGASRDELLAPLRGAARSALDLALLELEARRAGTTVRARLGLALPERIPTCFTLSVDTPEAMAERARARDRAPLLKVKLKGDDLDLARVSAVRRAAPRVPLWVDANEGWDEARYRDLAPRLGDLGVALLEQPLPAGRDEALARLPRPVPVCADESAHDADSIPALADRYDAVNVKLDKAGGLLGALAALDAAERAGLRVALGCMVSSSLAIAPACLLASRADWVDLDGSVLLSDDHEGGARLDDEGWLIPPSPALWGG